MADVTATALDDLPNAPFCGAQTFFARRCLGVSSFGMQVWRLPRGPQRVPAPTTRRTTRRKRSTWGSAARPPSRPAARDHTITQGVFVRVAPGVHRNITTGASGAEILALGATPGEASVAPSWT